MKNARAGIYKSKLISYWNMKMDETVRTAANIHHDNLLIQILYVASEIENRQLAHRQHIKTIQRTTNIGPTGFLYALAKMEIVLLSFSTNERHSTVIHCTMHYHRLRMTMRIALDTIWPKMSVLVMFKWWKPINSPALSNDSNVQCAEMDLCVSDCACATRYCHSTISEHETYEAMRCECVCMCVTSDSVSSHHLLILLHNRWLAVYRILYNIYYYLENESLYTFIAAHSRANILNHVKSPEWPCISQIAFHW